MNTPFVALVTGASRGLGKGLATHLASRPAAIVVGCSRNPPPEGDLPFEHVVCDVTDEGQVQDLFRDIRRRHGRLDALVNNAGVASMNHALLTPASTVDRVLQTNVKATFLCCREAARMMGRNGSGRIVNVVSVAAPLRLEGEAIYAASKAAVTTLTHVLAREFAPFGITVNAVGPTPIETDLIKNVPREKLDALVARQAIPRFGRVEDVANVVDFFLRAESGFVTGQVLYLGGV